MKYLIDSRYKRIHGLLVSLKAALQSYERGRSSLFHEQLSLLQDQSYELDVMRSPPFTEEQIEQISSIEMQIQEFLKLPTDFDQIGEGLAIEVKGLLDTIDPFTLVVEDSVHSRREKLNGYAKELQVYLSSCVTKEDKEALTPEERSIIEDIMRDIYRVPQTQLTEIETNLIIALGHLLEEFTEDASLDLLDTFYEIARELEIQTDNFKNPPFQTLREIITFLREVIQEAEPLMTSDQDSFAKYSALYSKDKVVQAIEILKTTNLPSSEMAQIQSNIILGFENGQLELGDTFVSRCRSIDFYHLFGTQVSEMEELLALNKDLDIDIS